MGKAVSAEECSCNRLLPIVLIFLHVNLYCRNLCDTKGIGKLNSEQFALAMFLVKQKLNGIDPPPQLTPEMVPPSLRPKPGTADPTAFGVAVSDLIGCSLIHLWLKKK